MPVSRANHGSSGPRHQISQKTGALRTVESCAGPSRYESPKGLVDATKTLSIAPAKFLFLHLKRFTDDLHVRRDVISFQAKLDLRPFCHRDGSHAFGSTDSADEREYALIGVIMHRCTGISQQSGHYWAYARTVDRDWLECDDARVTEVTEAIVLKAGAGSAGGGSAYMLVYEAVSQPGQRLSRVTRV